MKIFARLCLYICPSSTAFGVNLLDGLVHDDTLDVPLELVAVLPGFTVPPVFLILRRRRRRLGTEDLHARVVGEPVVELKVLHATVVHEVIDERSQHLVVIEAVGDEGVAS